MWEPYFISLPEIGEKDLGFISVGESSREIPFHIKRVFWTYRTPAHILRGGHAHLKAQEVIVALKGTITIQTEQQNGMSQKFFTLSQPDKGLYIPTKTWFTLQYTEDVIQLTICSTYYDKDDYIHDYQTFKALN